MINSPNLITIFPILVQYGYTFQQKTNPYEVYDFTQAMDQIITPMYASFYIYFQNSW
jgi:hypothetical protein